MRNWFKVIGAAALLSATVAPATVQAFGGPGIFSGTFKPVGVTGGATVCAFNPYNDPGFGEAEISFFSTATGNTSVGGTWWSSSTNTVTFNPVTVSDLETDCPFSDVVILSQIGADAASYSAEDLYELEWSATFDDDGQSYIYRVALEGVSTTSVVNTRTLNTPVNVAPVANAGANQSVQSGTEVTLDGSSSSDSDGTIAAYAWTRTGGTGSAANAVLSDATAQSPTFTDSSLTSNDAAVTHEFSLIVTDDDADASPADTVIITITPPDNAVPTAAASAAQTTVTTGTQVALLGTGTDSDGTIAAYAWTRTGGTGSAANAVLSDATAQNPTFTDSSLSLGDTPVTHEFALIVTDDDADASPADTVTITITPPDNVPPTAFASATQTMVTTGTQVELLGTGTDSDGTIVSYAWTRTGGTGSAANAALNDATAQNPTFADSSLIPGDTPVTHEFELVVTDDLGASSAPSSVSITINPPASPVTEATDGAASLMTTLASPASTCSIASFSVSPADTSRPGVADDGVGIAADFTLTGCDTITAESVEVSLDLGVVPASGSAAYKIGPDGEWLAIEGATIAGSVVTYTLLDNGPLDLDDALGAMRDPVTVAMPASNATPVPSLPFYGLVLLSVLLGLAGVRGPKLR